MHVGYSCMLSLFIFQVPITRMVGYNHVYVGHGSIIFLKNNSWVFLLIITCMWAMIFFGVSLLVMCLWVMDFFFGLVFLVTCM